MIPSHIIHRQSIRTHVVGNALQATEVQQQIADLLQSHHYFTALDKVLTEFSGVGAWLEVDRVDVNLGTFSIGNFEKAFIEKIQTALREKLFDAIPDAILAGKTVQKTNEDLDFEALLYFLENGVLPFYALSGGIKKGQSQQGFEKWVDSIVTNLSDTQLSFLVRLLQKSGVARQRLFYAFSEKTVFLILKKINPSTPLSILTLKKVKSIFLKSETARQDSVFAFLIFKIQDKVLLEAFEVLMVKIVRLNVSKTEQESAILNFINNQTPPDANNVIKEKAVEKQVEKVSSDTVFIQNAGIVLLHPFMSLCFETCNWLKDGYFKNERTQYKALLMLHFLAIGKAQATEFDLFLPKILCGIPENTPIPQGKEGLTKKEKAEGEALLQAAIAHWQVLKNTSPDGLREGFLQRDGKLERNAFGGWTLTVEQKAQDILLSQLPYGWGVSMVKFDWMKEVLEVNWA